MLKKGLLSPLFSSLLGVSLLVIAGCGKRAETKKIGQSSDHQTAPPVISDVEALLGKQEVVCEQGKFCPNYIAKVAIVHGSKVNFCTGFLANRNIVATATSCLTDLLRLNNQDCSRDVFFFFPNHFNRSSFRVGCKKVLQVSQIDSNNPILWRDDVTFLQLEEPVPFRRSLYFSREGLENNKFYTMWGIEQVDKHTAFIRRMECEAVHKSYVNPLAAKASSPNMMFAGCVLKAGNAGAPIVDSRGRVRGMVSRQMDLKLRDYINSTDLLSEPLKEMFHATNFACAPLLYDTDVMDERECTKELNYAALDNSRAEMLSLTDSFNNLRLKLEERLSGLNQYFNIGVNLRSSGDTQEVELFPKCFKDVSSWLSTLNLSRNAFSFNVDFPQISFQKVMDQYGRLSGKEVEQGEKRHFIQFSPKNLKRFRNSRVFLWNDEINLTFNNVTETCF